VRRRPWPISAWCPQLGNARRFGSTLTLSAAAEAEAAAKNIKAFSDAAPEKQPDAE